MIRALFTLFAVVLIVSPVKAHPVLASMPWRTAWDEGNFDQAAEFVTSLIEQRLEAGQLWTEDMAQMAFVLALDKARHGETHEASYWLYVAWKVDEVCEGGLSRAFKRYAYEHKAQPGRSVLEDEFFVNTPFTPTYRGGCQASAISLPELSSPPMAETKEDALRLAVVGYERREGRLRLYEVAFEYPALSISPHVEILGRNRRLSSIGHRMVVYSPCLERGEEPILGLPACLGGASE